MTEAVATYDDEGLMIGRKVIRCANCKFREYETTYCNYFDAEIVFDGFCAWGEEREKR